MHNEQRNDFKKRNGEALSRSRVVGLSIPRKRSPTIDHADLRRAPPKPIWLENWHLTVERLHRHLPRVWHVEIKTSPQEKSCLWKNLRYDSERLQNFYRARKNQKTLPRAGCRTTTTNSLPPPVLFIKEAIATAGRQTKIRRSKPCIAENTRANVFAVAKHLRLEWGSHQSKLQRNAPVVRGPARQRPPHPPKSDQLAPRKRKACQLKS